MPGVEGTSREIRPRAVVFTFTNTAFNGEKDLAGLFPFPCRAGISFEIHREQFTVHRTHRIFFPPSLCSRSRFSPPAGKKGKRYNFSPFFPLPALKSRIIKNRGEQVDRD